MAVQPDLYPPVRAAQICTSDFAGVDPSGPTGVAKAYPGARGQMPAPQ